jgi:hypothetical protein
MINKYSNIDDMNKFLYNIYDEWLLDNNYIFYNTNLLVSLSKLLRIQIGKYYGFPNNIYMRLLYHTISLDILSIREDEDLQRFRQFLIYFFTFLEENAITGIIKVKNKEIINRLKFLKKHLNLKNLNENTISNTHIIMTLL